MANVAGGCLCIYGVYNLWTQTASMRRVVTDTHESIRLSKCPRLDSAASDSSDK